MVEFKKIKMVLKMIKKMVVLFLVISLALVSLTACDEDKGKNSSSGQDASSSQQ